MKASAICVRSCVEVHFVVLFSGGSPDELVADKRQVVELRLRIGLAP
jgi:hypothetical protein